jgi:hypothetical protein
MPRALATASAPSFDLAVNFLGYWEQAPDGTAQHFSGVRDIPISEDNLMTLM